ncbi:MAG: DEAD/DEAH box helicase, partial [Armatimonadetes bacterium]|nr:DEAD/DEAH box helicase [Armatimonadota bacterium]
MDAFSEPTRLWIAESFAAPTPAQAQAWAEIAAGGDVLVVAPTGSGKTLAAFLWSIDRIAAAPPPDPKKRLRVLYVSPLKALAADIERNLRAPLSGIRSAALRQGLPPGEITVGVRTGDTPSDERRRFTRTPPDILVTTPESLFLILTSQAREMLRSVDTVIVDEVHALVATKRGAHFALSLERLDRLAGARVQRIGLSATVQPVEEVARFLGGAREVAVVRPPARKALELRVEAPHEEGDEVWPALDARLLELVGAHRSTIVFANSRRLAERVSARLNESAGTAVARAHHGSINHELRRAIEEDLKAGRLPAVVATSSLELGID